jgi:hypothetical protein
LQKILNSNNKKADDLAMKVNKASDLQAINSVYNDYEKLLNEIRDAGNECS